MIIKIISYFFYFFFYPIWLIQKFNKRKKNIWLFGSWFGYKYSDNPRYLFEYIVRKKNKIRPIWLTRSNKVYNFLKNKNYEVYYIWSLKGIYFSLKSGVVIFSSGKKDINRFFINGAKVINLWHGAPIKKIGLSNEFVNSLFINRIKRNLFPYDYEYNVDFVVSTSPVFDNILSESFDLENEKIIKLGYPRNDVFFYKSKKNKFIETINKNFNNPFKIIFLPTFRNYEIDLFSNYNFNLKIISSVLNKNNAVLIYKGHYAENFNFNLKNNNRIILLEDSFNDEINYTIKDCDLLLTDYSGVYFDFLLTKKPIFFTPFDLNKYVKMGRKLNFNYNDIISGIKLESWSNFSSCLEDLLLNGDNFKRSREVKNNLFNKYNCGNSSAKLFEFIAQNQ